MVANADFMFNDVQNEPFAEQLREKVRFLKEKNMERVSGINPHTMTLSRRCIQNHLLASTFKILVRSISGLSRTQDFWLVVEPAWLEAKFPAEAKKVGRPCVALVSTNQMWITFMKLRLDRVLKLDLGEISKEDALKSAGALKDFKTPEKWTAPYGRYAYGWWEPFLPGNEAKPLV